MKRVVQAAVLLAIAAVPAYAGTPAPTVTPEPTTIALIATGLGAIGVGAWWKRRR